MPKYDSQLNDLKNALPGARNVLIALPQNLTTDVLSAGLALMLSLKQSGKQVSIVSSGTPMVTHTNLFGIGEVKQQIWGGGGNGGDFVITLEGVVDANGNVPSEKLDWYVEGQNLNLVFHTAPGQVFQPRNISTQVRSGGGNFDWIFTVGAQNLNELGAIYQQNSSSFNQNQIVNIDVNSGNGNFGRVNVVDPNASSLAEMVIQIIQGLNLPIDTDVASNILTGMYDKTANMTQNVKPDTFIAASAAMQAGGKIPGTNPVMQPVAQQQPFTMSADQNAPYQASPFLTQAPNISYAPAVTQSTQMNQPITSQPLQPSEPQTIAQSVNNPSINIPDTGQTYDLSKIFNAPVGPDVMEQQSNQQVAQQYSQAMNQQKAQNEERPSGEYSGSHNPETSPAPDWLVPKIYKGGNVG